MNTIPNADEPSLMILSDRGWILLYSDLHIDATHGGASATVPVRATGRHGTALCLSDLLFIAAIHGINVTYAVF